MGASAALTGMDHEMQVLAPMGLDARLLDAGCGMAGAFGFEREHYDVADGFSCREQILQGAGRRAIRLAEVVAAALPV